MLLQSPTLSKTQIAFAFGGDIWIVNRAGGDAHRLVTGTGLLSGPHFSPDGSMVAYTGNYDGNLDVYVVPAEGGEPRRLTYHPGPDVAVGWTPDGKSVLFVSRRFSYADSGQLFTMPIEGAFPSPLPLPQAEDGAYSPDGTHIAYSPYFQVEPNWKHYAGGQTTPIWIADLADSSIVKVPRDNSNDRNPLWIGDKVYFLSDRKWPRYPFRIRHEITASEAALSTTRDSTSSTPRQDRAPLFTNNSAPSYLYELHSGKTSGLTLR